MNSSKERLHSSEAAPISPWEALPDSTLTRTEAERLQADRAVMLGTLHSAIAPELFAVLERKVEYEYSALLHMLESDAQERHAIRERNKILDARYFTQVPLDTDALL